MATYTPPPPHLHSYEITTECHSGLVVFPAGILGFMPKHRANFFDSVTNTYRVQRVCFFNFQLSLCLLFSLKQTCDGPCSHPTQKKYPWQTNKPQVKPQSCVSDARRQRTHIHTHKAHITSSLHIVKAHAVSSSTGRYPSLSASSPGQLPRQPICLC